MKMIGKRALGTTIIYYIAFLTYVNVTEITDVYIYTNIMSLNPIRSLPSEYEIEKENLSGLYVLLIYVYMSKKGLATF